MRGIRSTLLLTSAGALSACFMPNADETAPCNTDGQCLPGYVCMQNVCAPRALFPEAAMPEAPAPGTLGPAGGIVNGPGGIRLVVPANALDTTVTLTLKRVTAGTNVAGPTPISAVYRVDPTDVRFKRPAQIFITFVPHAIPPPAGASDAAVWQAATDSAAYQRLATVDTGVGEVGGVVLQGGWFVVAVRPGLIRSRPRVVTSHDSVPGFEVERVRQPPAPPPSADTEVSVFGRNCAVDALACSGDESYCHRGASASICTGTCSFSSDCPTAHCCKDLLSDGNAATTMCVPSAECTGSSASIPDHRACTINDDCKRGGTCIAGSCFSAGGIARAKPGEACTTPTDCDLAQSDHCLQRMGSGTWVAGDLRFNAGAVQTACAAECDDNNACGDGFCCRHARMPDGAPRAYCVRSDTPGSCGSVTGQFSSCHWSNPTTCDPTTTDDCIAFEGANAEGQYCSSQCSGSGDCAGGVCCALGGYGGQNYCVQGQACP